jgi:hypothetical protein
MMAWIIEHTLLLLPTGFWFAFAVIGATIYFFSDFVSAIPPFVPYAKFVKAGGGIMLLAGVYLSGGAGITAEWQRQVTEMQQQVAVAEKSSKDANELIRTMLQEKTKVIYERQIIVQEKIAKDSEKMDAVCQIDPVAIEDLNLAAGGKKK